MQIWKDLVSSLIILSNSSKGQHCQEALRMFVCQDMPRKRVPETWLFLLDSGPLSLHLQGCVKVKASLCSPCTGASIKTPFCYGRKPALGPSRVCILQPSSPHEKSSLLIDRHWITSDTKNIHHAVSEQSPNPSTIKHKLILEEYEILIQQKKWSKSGNWVFL